MKEIFEEYGSILMASLAALALVACVTGITVNGRVGLVGILGSQIEKSIGDREDVKEKIHIRDGMQGMIRDEQEEYP